MFHNILIDSLTIYAHGKRLHFTIASSNWLTFLKADSHTSMDSAIHKHTNATFS